MSAEKGFVIFSRGEPPMFFGSSGLWVDELQDARIFNSRHEAEVITRDSSVALGYEQYDTAVELRQLRLARKAQNK